MLAAKAGPAPGVEDLEPGLRRPHHLGRGLRHQRRRAVLESRQDLVEALREGLEHGPHRVVRGAHGHLVARARREQVSRHRTLGLEGQPLPVHRRRLVDAIPPVEQGTQPAIRVEVVRPQRDRRPVLGERFGHPLQRLVRLGEIHVGIGHVGAQRDGPLIAGGRVFVPLLACEGVAEIVVGVGQLGVQRERPLVGAGRFLDATLLLEHVAEVVVRVRIVGRQLDRLPDERLGLRHAVELSYHHAAEVPGVGIVGRHGQDAPVELVGRLQTALLLQLAGVRHRVGERELRRLGRNLVARGHERDSSRFDHGRGVAS